MDGAAEGANNLINASLKFEGFSVSSGPGAVESGVAETDRGEEEAESARGKELSGGC